MLGAHLGPHLLGVRPHVVAAGVGVVKRVLHRGTNGAFRFGAGGGVHVVAHADPGEWHGELRVALPPLAEVDELREPVRGIREAALVNDQPCVDLAGRHRLQDAVVAQFDDVAELRCGEAQQTEGGGLATGNGHTAVHGLLEGRGVACHHERAHTVSECRSTAQHGVAIAHGGKGAHTELREVELPGVGAAIELLDIEQHRPDPE